jgi:5-methyltetrahydrofolate--homocysteine methyltransferase
LVGGAPLNEEFATAVGADAYCRDAAVASQMAKELVTAKRQRTAEPPGPSVN